MKTNLRSLLVASLLLPVVVWAEPFEGKVDFNLNTGRGTQKLSYSMKGDKIRIDLPTARGMAGMIVEPAKNETTILLPEQKMYMSMPMPDVQKQAAEAKPGDVALEKTGVKENILGHAAEKFISTYQGNQTELWLAEGLGSFIMPGQNPMASGRGGAALPTQGWEQALAGKELFPLRVVSKGKDGKESFRMEATAINKQSLSDALFMPPADFQKFDMGAMMNGAMRGGFPAR